MTTHDYTGACCDEPASSGIHNEYPPEADEWDLLEERAQCDSPDTCCFPIR